MSASSVAFTAPSSRWTPWNEESTRRVRPDLPASRADTAEDRLDLPALTDILEELDTGVIVCGEDGRVLLANNAARRELHRGRPLRVDEHGLLQVGGESPPKQPWRLALRSAIHGRRRLLLPLGEGTDRLMVSVMPLGPQPRPAGLLLLGRRQHAPELAVELLGSHYKLTGAERAVLLALLAGHRVEEVARLRRVKLCTLRTQVASLRSKLGVPRLDDLVRLVSELPPMAGALRSPALRLGGTAATLPPSLPMQRPLAALVSGAHGHALA